MDKQFTERELHGAEWGWDPVHQQENHGCLAIAPRAAAQGTKRRDGLKPEPMDCLQGPGKPGLGKPPDPTQWPQVFPSCLWLRTAQQCPPNCHHWACESLPAACRPPESGRGASP